MSNFKGTWRLVRLNLRLDRVKMPIWIIGIAGLMMASAPALADIYGTPEAQVGYASTSANSVAARVFGGSIDGPSLGGITMIEMYIFTAVLIAFMCTLSIVRHTRQNEENGRSELVGSTVVGRYSEMSAAIITTSIANVLTCALLYLSLLSIDQLSSTGVLGLSLTYLCVGFSFTGIALLASQISETSRGANSLSAIAIGLAFFIRGVGDGFASVSVDGLSATTAWPTWLSPLGWGSLIQPFTSQNWWIFGLFGAFIATSFLGAALIVRKRDVGLGLVRTKEGSPVGKKRLLSATGLAIKLQRNIFIGWFVLAVVLGLTYGGLAKEFSKLIEANEEISQAFAQFGGDGDITDIFFAAMYSITAITMVGYALQSLMRTRSEETTGHLESVLSTATSRTRWFLSQIVPPIVGSVIIMVTTGLTAGATYIAISDAGLDQLAGFTAAPLAYLPATLAMYGLGVLLFGVLPKLTAAISWGAFALCFMISQFAVLLELPNWVMNISPFSHTGLVPADPVNYTPVWILSASALAMLTAGLMAFVKRDINTA